MLTRTKDGQEGYYRPLYCLCLYVARNSEEARLEVVTVDDGHLHCRHVINVSSGSSSITSYWPYTGIHILYVEFNIALPVIISNKPCQTFVIAAILM